MIANLAQLLDARARIHPTRRLGTPENNRPMAELFPLAQRIGAAIGGAGLVPGTCAMVIGRSSLSYLITWMALHIAGVQTALVNPDYPADLLNTLAEELQPDAVIWVGRAPAPAVYPAAPWFDTTAADSGRLVRSGESVSLGTTLPVDPPGIEAKPTDIASYMHTSGTSGVPKFCAQSHEYFIRLGRFIADGMGFSDRDTVFAPLPLFHINPLGYGVVGGLTAGCNIFGWEKFSASKFWQTVKSIEATALILHGPPAAILKRRYVPNESDTHHVRIAFAADPDFLRMFKISQGISAYGSTEAAGLTHMWRWRPEDIPDVVEGASHYAGRERYDIAWKIGMGGEILVKDTAGRALFSGYRRNGTIHSAVDDQGWFDTGDLGRTDQWGNLVFIERQAESVRVNGEYVPIGFVEDQLRGIAELGEIALWRQPDPVAGHRLILYVAGAVPVDKIRAVSGALPAFMRPARAYRIDEIPRDTGVGKVRRRLLDNLEPLEIIELQ